MPMFHDTRSNASRIHFIIALSLFCLSQIASAQDIGLSKQFSLCMDKANSTTMVMLDCIDTETKRQDGRLNKAYKEAMAQLSPDRKKQLQQAQRAWIGYRDANCAFYADPEGGTMARLVASDCFMSATATRAKELESLAGMPTEQSRQPLPVAKNTPPESGALPAKSSPPALTGPQKNAVRAAQSYLSISGFSRDGLIAQLSSPAGNGFDVTDATIAVDSMNIDWKQEAVKSAKQYLQLMGFSCQGLIQQLSSRAGNKYTVEEAQFGAKQAGAC